MDVSESHPLFPTYTKYPITLLKGEGSRVWDDQGKEYLDCKMRQKIPTASAWERSIRDHHFRKVISWANDGHINCDGAG